MMISKACSVWVGNLILVNAAHHYHGDMAPSELTPVGKACSGVLMERRAATLLGRLMEHIRSYSSIVPVSGWRSEQEQQKIWDHSIRDSGEAFTRQYVAKPGCSEHQTGLAIDLGLFGTDIDFIRPEFPYTGICQTFRKQAARYGFIERYPSGKEHITGIAHEPWHFRYVGVPHAEIMERFGLTLEEYHRLLRGFSYGIKPLVYMKESLIFEVYYLPGDAIDEISTENSDSTNRMLSGNNTDGFIITEWRENG